MSDYQQFLQERDRIDFLIEKGYKIKSVVENLSGAILEFEKGTGACESLQVLTANGRKYFSSLLINQQRKQIN